VIPLRDANPTRRRPVITLALITACIVVFAWELGVLASGGEEGLSSLFRQFGATPASLVGALQAGNLVSAATLAVFSSLFLHAGWLHLLGNLLYLWIFGNNIEDRLGRTGFILFYLAGGVIAVAAHVATDAGSEVPMIGASGAISAALGAYLVLFPRARILSLVFLGFFYQLVEIRALLVLGFWFVLQLIDGVASLGASAEGGVAFFAHIGGFAFGMGVGAILRLRGRRKGSNPLPAAGVG
jgi:membrane associated rhomboid family serine protease